jgi:hypothetical protein
VFNLNKNFDETRKFRVVVYTVRTLVPTEQAEGDLLVDKVVKDVFDLAVELKDGPSICIIRTDAGFKIEIANLKQTDELILDRSYLKKLLIEAFLE